MRLLPMGLAIVALSLPALGQTASSATLSPPVPPPLPRPWSIKPPPPSAPELMAPGLELKFPHWREVLTKNEPLVQYRAKPRPMNLKPDLIASARAASGHCSIPLIEIPLPEHFDDPMTLKMAPRYDDKMLLPTPPVCPLHDEHAEPAKRK